MSACGPRIQMNPPRPKPFRLQIPDAALADLRERLARTRWPDEPPLAPWSSGTSVAYLKALAEYWRAGFDWRAEEAKLNALPQYTMPIRGINVHFIHVPGTGRNPMPLLLAHGWPGSVLEFLKLIPLLREQFTIIAPSLPGYTMSFKPGQERCGVEEIAAIFAELMGVLGYEKFAAQGGDWGAFVCSRLGVDVPRRLIGIHLNLLAVRRDPKAVVESDPEQKKYLGELATFLKEETGYQWIQGTKPQTLAFGLTDSPAGLAAWLVEKFRSWTDCDGNPQNALTRDEMLAGISLYWFSGAIGSSFWPYYARMHRPWPIPEGTTVDVPMGYAAFPKEILRPPRSLAAQTYTDIRRWSVMEKGGHFAALEQPQALAREVKAFFAALG
ncbi:MAG: epoxide hydrolase 1 [Betaproteobacteria bacterium]|nr:epoxide hydrolase 1 [Betaproteobacteria bacterium]